jgi:hypothetical protein
MSDGRSSDPLNTENDCPGFNFNSSIQVSIQKFLLYTLNWMSGCDFISVVEIRGSGLDPDPGGQSRKIDPQKRQKIINLIFLSAGCSFLSAEASPVSLTSFMEA